MCKSLIEIKNKSTGDPVRVPCGKCPDCRKRRVSEWSFRLLYEERNSLSSSFVTLTFNTGFVSYSLDKSSQVKQKDGSYKTVSRSLITRNKYLTLNKPILQDFLKRLRKLEGHDRVKYYAVGEYGSDNFRPHYHLILFNCMEYNVTEAWTYVNKGKQYAIGNVFFGSATGSSVGYVLKYMCKTSKIPLHRNDDRLPEFSLMSKGLGKCYLTQQAVDYHLYPDGSNAYCQVPDGPTVAMPRYYKKILYEGTPLKQIVADYGKNRAEEQHEKYVKRMLKLHGPDWKRVEFEYLQSQIRKQQKNIKNGQKL